jgi:hypothetical protein
MFPVGEEFSMAELDFGSLKKPLLSIALAAQEVQYMEE